MVMNLIWGAREGANRVGLDSEKKTFGAKMQKDPKGRVKRLLGTGKVHMI